MPFARWQATIVDGLGNVQPGASIEVRNEAGGGLASLFSDRNGAAAISNPFTADANGFAAFHVAGGAYQIVATLGGFSRTWRYVAIGTAGEIDQVGLLFSATSSTNLTPGVGAKAFTLAVAAAFKLGQKLRAASAAAPTTKYMEGIVTAYDGALALTITVDPFSFAGGAASDWVISLGTGQTGPSAPFGMNHALNLALTASVAANALTIAIKGLDGQDPSAANPVHVQFRDPTATTGVPITRSLTAALSFVVSSGSTLGTANNVAFRIWLVLFDDGGTLRLGVINCLSGTNIYPLGEWPIASATAEGGAGAADSAHVFYTGTAVSAKAYAILGYLTYESGLATAGTWSAGPTRLHVHGSGDKLPGDTVQIQRTATAAVNTGSTTIPADDTIPQNTEGNEYMTVTITPRSAANILDIESKADLASNGSSIQMIMALFQDSVANALAATTCGVTGSANNSVWASIVHLMRAATAAATTFTIRAGGAAAATTTFNGVNAARRFGGVCNSDITVREIMG